MLAAAMARRCGGLRAAAVARRRGGTGAAVALAARRGAAAASASASASASSDGAAAHRGVLSREKLAALVRAGEVDSVVVGMVDMYGRLMGKRYDAEYFVERGVHGTHACNYLLTCNMAMEPVQGFAYSSWQSGYGDLEMAADFDTLRVCGWRPREAIVLCDAVDVRSGERVPFAPRSVLKAQIERAEAASGYRAMTASELEYYVYHESYRDAAEQRYADLTPNGTYAEDYHVLQGSRGEPLNGAMRQALKRMGVVVENSKGEFGVGQHELNIEYADALRAADNHVYFKQCFREIADQLGISVTFMAKPDAAQAGSSCHLHLSLAAAGDAARNAFVGDERCGDVDGCSATFRHFLGGWMRHTPALMAFYAPTVNSYKRFASASWAPTGLHWSVDNRTAAFRIVGVGTQALRIECRLPGADANPYLAFAASLAAGLDGVRERTEPPPMLGGNAYDADDASAAAARGDGANDAHGVPRTLGAAAERLAASDFARAAFGDDVVEHYAHHFRNEWREYCAAVTDFERARYFEQI